MKIALITRNNGVGLSTDVELLQSWLTELEHEVHYVDWRLNRMDKCDVAISLELINPTLMRYARANIGVFNLEWLPTRWKRYLSLFTQVWAKSLESQCIYDQLRVRSEYTGFLGRDMLDASVERAPTCLHVRGRSSLKGTDTVLQVWQQHTDLPPLTVISHVNLAVPRGVRLLPQVDFNQLKHEMNSHLIHVCPSVSEGWGHYIVEGLSTGALVVTTDASPMNEHIRQEWGFLTPATSSGFHHFAPRHSVAVSELAACVKTALALSSKDIAQHRAQAREHFERRNAQFCARAAELLGVVMSGLPRASLNNARVARTQVRSKFSSKRVTDSSDVHKPLPENAELVIVPAWRRADFLLATLTRLRDLDGENRHYWIAVDRAPTADVLQVAENFKEVTGRTEIKRRAHRHHGNSYNLLTSYREAAAAGASLVHLIEEDIFIADDYFDFHARAHALCPDAFAVSACRNQNLSDDPPPEDDAVYRHSRYQSLGVSFRPDVLRALVVPHATVQYLNQPINYCKRAFPKSSIVGFTEQDGLLNRVVEAARRHVVYPAVPRAYHAGFVGYNRLGDALTGTTEENAARLLQMTEEELNARARSYPDHRVTALSTARRVTELRVIDWSGT